MNCNHRRPLITVNRRRLNHWKEFKDIEMKRFAQLFQCFKGNILLKIFYPHNRRLAKPGFTCERPLR